MNEKLQQELLRAVTNINDSSETVLGFLEGQLPDVVNQLLIWHGIYSFVGFILGILVLIGLVVINYKFYLWATKNKFPDWIVFFYAFQTFPIVFAIMAIFELGWLKIWITPKVWLLEYIQNFV